MTFTKTLVRHAAGLLGSLALTGAALAAPTYGSIAAPGVYFGSGNQNTNFRWHVDTANNIEVALRAKDRGTLQVLDSATGVYNVMQGLCNPVCGGGPKAKWNYEFSVNVRADGTGNADLSNYIVQLLVDTDGSLAQTWTTIDVLDNWPDNAYWNGARTVTRNPSAGDYGVQQSANPLFGDSGFGFLPGAGEYDIRLSVYQRGVTGGLGDLLASTGITINVVPTPGTLALTGLALLGMAGLRRRKTA